MNWPLAMCSQTLMHLLSKNTFQFSGSNDAYWAISSWLLCFMPYLDSQKYFLAIT